MAKIKPICTLRELQKLMVINLSNGKQMGKICDLELDLILGNVTAVFVPKKTGLTDLFSCREDKSIRIPWCDIERIGDDTILVRWNES